MILFVGAGPGDPDLITVRGQRALQEAQLIIYAGSLVPEAVLKWADPAAEIHNSASMHLAAIINLMTDAVAAGRRAVRLHTGDPSIFGAIAEQMRELRARQIPYQVIPGVSSFLAAAAAIPAELTAPGITQTVIITRTAGRTPVPPGQDIASLAAHRATLAIFLSADLGDSTQADLLQHYPAETAVAIVEKASWPEQRVLHCQLSQLARTLRDNDITRTAMILVGDALKGEGDASLLYASHFTHGYRQGEN